MTISRPCYATRERVKRLADIKLTAHNDWQVDDAIEAASDAVDALLHRAFYPTVATHYFDWPNFQYAYPWRLWLDNKELADITTTVPVVTTGGVVIPSAACNFEPVNSGPPYNYLELRRDMPYAFGVGQTPQRDIGIAGVYGFWTRTAPGGALAAALSDTTGTTAIVSNGALIGVGDHILIGSERMLVTDQQMTATGQTQQGSGVSTAQKNDVLLQVTDGTQYAPQEVVQLDAEQMLITSVTGNFLTVLRAWNGTTLATHAGATVYAARQLTVMRGALGTTAASHTNGTAVAVGLVPPLVRQLAEAEAVVEVAQQVGAYAATQGDGQSKVVKIGTGLPDLRDRCYTAYGRKARIRVV